MSTEKHQITVNGLPVEVVRKNIKNLHLGVYPPAGRVRVAAPLRVSNEAVRLAVVGKLGWIRRQQASFARQPRESAREMVSGESHYFLGRRYRLHVLYGNGPVGVVVRNKAVIELRVRPRAGVTARRRLLMSWYRQQLKEMVLPMLKKWQKRLGVRVSDFGI